MPRLLAIGPALDQSSYARVVRETLKPLGRRWTVRQFAPNHRGVPVDAGWPVLPNRDIADRYGVEQIAPIVADFDPDAIFIFNSFANLPRYAPLIDRLGSRRPRLVAQCPLLGPVTDPRLVARLAWLDCLVILSDGVKQHLAACLAESMRLGLIDRMPTLATIPHGFDATIFHPLGDRAALRRTIPGLHDLGDDAFVVLNANKNEPRKRIDLTLQGFARFAEDKPPNVRLYLHMGDPGGELRQLASALGIASRVVLASSEDGAHPRLDDASLNRLYNACDVGLNTASSEGWGMIGFEHAATGAAQIVPGAWICGELWKDHGELLEPASEQTSQHGYTCEISVTADSVASALQRLYRDETHRSRMAGQAATLAASPRFQWTAIADRWDGLLREICSR